MFFVRIPYCYGIVKMRSYHCFIQWQERVFVKKLEVLRIIFVIFVALFTAWLMWSSKNSFVSIITPTSFCFSIVLSGHMEVCHRIFDFSNVIISSSHVCTFAWMIF